MPATFFYYFCHDKPTDKMEPKLNEHNNKSAIEIFTSEDGATQLQVKLENETVWLSTHQMAMLFNREESNIRRHVINVFKEGELTHENNVHFLHVNGIKKPVPFYNLDVIISVGYRVKSQRGFQFRRGPDLAELFFQLAGQAVQLFQKIHVCASADRTAVR